MKPQLKFKQKGLEWFIKSQDPGLPLILYMVYQELKEYCQDSVCFFPSLVFLCLALFSGKLSAFGNRMLPAHIFSVILVGRGKRISFPIVLTNLLEVSLMGLAWVMCPFLNQSQWSW